ncbi:MAG: hypothetical protein Q9M23_08615 [Mariprofundaceae bacterium]|nr:hypothetical protein [Mariprofundaceae bacterium]
MTDVINLPLDSIQLLLLIRQGLVELIEKALLKSDFHFNVLKPYFVVGHEFNP